MAKWQRKTAKSKMAKRQWKGKGQNGKEKQAKLQKQNSKTVTETT